MADSSGSVGRYGKAGTSLGSEEARRKYGKSAQIGAKGERWLTSALKRDPLTARYSMWQSLGIPTSPSGGKRYGGDVDVVLANGNTVVLIDCKMWASGKVYWTFLGRPMQGLKAMTKSDGSVVTRNAQMSRNMELAVTRYSENLPNAVVKGIVIFVPTGGGNLPASVKLLRWPGGIRSYLPADGARKIHRMLGDPQPVEPRIQGLLGRMVRG